MKAILEKRIQNQSLTKDEAKNTLLDIGQGKCNSHQVAAFLTTYMMLPITVEELSGFRAALLDLCIPIDLSDYDPIDLCGTCLLYTSPSPRDLSTSRMPSSA